MATNKKIVIEYDINGKAVDVAIDKTLNLKRQVVELTKALRSAKEGSDEFKLLSSRLSDTQDQLAKTTAKSRDLFGSLSMLPGPVGQFFGQLQGGIELLKTFSSFTFKDLQFQFKETANDIGDIADNFAGTGKVIDEVGGASKNAGDNIDEFAKRAENAASNLAGTTVQTENLTKSLENAGKSYQYVSIETDALGRKTVNAIKPIKDMTAAEFELFKAEQKAAFGAGEQAVATEGLVAAEKTATFWTTTLGNTIKGVLIGTGIGLAIVLIGQLVTWLYKYVDGTEAAEKAQKSFNEELDRTNVLLDLDLKDAKRRQAIKIADLKATGKDAKTIRDQEVKDLKENLALTETALSDAGKRENAVMKRTDEKAVEDLKVAQKKTTELDQQAKDLRTAIRVKELSNIEENNKASLELRTKALEKLKVLQGNRLKELEALIKLEIDKEKTGKTELEALLKEKLAIRQKLEKLSLAERKVIIAENAKITNDAIIEDNQRVIQGEIDKYTRLTIEEGVLTDEFYEARRKQAEQQLRFELQEADKDEKTKLTKRENARTKYWKALVDIDKEALEARLGLEQTKENAEYEGTVAFFQKQRDVEDANYEVQQAAARGNYDKLEALKNEHQKKMIAIDVAELNYKAGLEQRKATTEQDNYTKVEDRFVESFDVIKQLNQRKFDDLRMAEDYSYQAQIKAAGDNALAKEQIEREHADKLAQIKAQEFEAQKQTTLAIEQVTAQFGQTMAEIGDMMIQQGQGRDKKMFEAGKKAAIAGIAIDKASAIASIITNTAIANAKSVAAFPLTLGQPWVTINTVSAALSIAATLAAGIKAISQINSTSFDTGGSAGGGEKSNMLGRNYGDGGMIEGPRHAAGGVPIVAEGGEAIMTRGAVTSFGPLLSMLNQAGGGTSFSQGAVGSARFDNPKVTTTEASNQPMVIKTYVVSNDMTTEQQKQARLKDLSTL